MTREIKFRGRHVDNGEWVYGYLIGQDVIVGSIVEWDSEYFNTEFWYKVKPDTVGQYTGLKDRNGKEIYEGDIVQITGDQELDYGLNFEWNETATVQWSEDECGFYLDVIAKREVGLCEDGSFTVDTFPLRKWHEGEWSMEYAIIGNIHSNPDLLEVST